MQAHAELGEVLMSVGGHHPEDNQDDGCQHIAPRNPAGMLPGMPIHATYPRPHADDSGPDEDGDTDEGDEARPSYDLHHNGSPAGGAVWPGVVARTDWADSMEGNAVANPCQATEPAEKAPSIDPTVVC
jgi:hypothetical protein